MKPSVVATAQASARTRAKTDPRAAKTRRIIFSAVETLATEPATGISVGEIVRVAGISRSSFYAHFSGVSELASEFLREQVAEIGGLDLQLEQPASGSAAAISGLTTLMTHMVEGYPLYAGVLDLPLSRTGHDEIVDAYAERMRECIDAADGVPASVSPELVATYLAGGALTLIGSWMRTGTPDVAPVDTLVALLPAWLSGPAH